MSSSRFVRLAVASHGHGVGEVLHVGGAIARRRGPHRVHVLHVQPLDARGRVERLVGADPPVCAATRRHRGGARGCERGRCRGLSGVGPLLCARRRAASSGAKRGGARGGGALAALRDRIVDLDCIHLNRAVGFREVGGAVRRVHGAGAARRRYRPLRRGEPKRGREEEGAEHADQCCGEAGGLRRDLGF